MRWPAISSSRNEDDDRDKQKDDSLGNVSPTTLETVQTTVSDLEKGVSRVDSTTWRVFTDPQVLAASVVLTGSFIGLFRFYRSFLRRIPTASNIHPSFFRKRSIFGKVTSVGDGDNFRIYHTPGGRLAGWSWLPWRKIPTEKKDLKDQTIHVRLAGIDAPELAHFGRPSQPYAQEALDWLTAYVLGRRVRAYVYRPDQYSRVVATVYVWKGLWKRDVGLQMLRAGLATVYEAKTGVEFGVGREQKYRNAEWWAKLKRKGMWAGNRADYESPRAYKTRYASQVEQPSTSKT